MGSAEKFSHMKLNVYHDDSIGDRKYMEDIVLIAANHTDGSDEHFKSSLPFACFFVFDGHGGVEAAKFARTTLLSQLLAQENLHSDDIEKVVSSIKQGFIKTQELMLNDSSSWPKYNGRTSTSGTTVSMVMIRKRKMFVAHVGDSRVVLGEKVEDGLKPVVLTEDHKPDDPKELKRIKEDGGDVINRNGVPRVVWKRKRFLRGNDDTYDLVPFLAVSRSLGDFWSYNPEKKVYTVSPEPDVSVHDIDPGKLGCIVMASDGLWNVIKTESVMEFVQKNYMSGNVSHLNFASGLVNDTISSCALRKLKADNTSVIVICPEMQESEYQHDADYFTVKIISNSSDLRTDTLNAVPEKQSKEEKVIPEPKDVSVPAFPMPLQTSEADSESKDDHSCLAAVVPVLEPLTKLEANEVLPENEKLFKKVDHPNVQDSEMILEQDKNIENEPLVLDDKKDSSGPNDNSVYNNLKTNIITDVKCSLVNDKLEAKDCGLDTSFDCIHKSSISESQQLISSPFARLNIANKNSDVRSLKRKSKSYSESDSKRSRWVTPGSGPFSEGCNGRAPLETLQVCS